MYVLRGDNHRFDDRFSSENPKYIQDISPEIHFKDQPEYIHFASFDEHLIGFLCLPDCNFEKLRESENHVMISSQLTIPAKFRMVKLSELLECLKEQDDKAIKIGEQLFYEDKGRGKRKKSLLINACAQVWQKPENGYEAKIGIDLDPCGGDCSIDAFGAICVRTVLAYREIKGSSSLVQHNPIIFYIDKDEIKMRGEAWKMFEKLFEDELKEASYTGMFAIPVELPDKGICYFLIPNVNDYDIEGAKNKKGTKNDKISYPEGGVKGILKNWIDTLEKNNDNEKPFYGAIDDPMVLHIDDWMAAVCRKARPIDPPPQKSKK